MRRPALAACLFASLTAQAEEPAAPRPGGERSTRTAVLETGAELLQSHAPPEQLSVYMVGFHPMKHDPSHQMEAHHYCHQASDEFAQCALFDGNGKEARLNGVEYIISERLFETAAEKKYWHPHNYEILSGQLMAPGIPGPVEHQVMADKINSYGKTWHVWRTGAHGQPADPLPFGDPHLAWSFNRDGEARPGLVEARDESLGIDTEEKERGRQDLVAKAKPQCGVDALRGKLDGAASDLLPGVAARDGGCPQEP